MESEFDLVARQPSSVAIPSLTRRHPRAASQHRLAERMLREEIGFVIAREFGSKEDGVKFADGTKRCAEAWYAGDGNFDPGFEAEHAAIAGDWRKFQLNKSIQLKAMDRVCDAARAEGENRLLLAKQALSLDENCVDALVLLAEEEVDLRSARDLFEKAVSIAERNGVTLLKDNLQSRLENAPYSRAKSGLGECLWYMGERDAAISHFSDLVRDDAHEVHGTHFDSQGALHLLMACLLEARQFDLLSERLKETQWDPSAAWQYNQALCYFGRSGEIPRSGVALTRALRLNQNVALFLSGEKAFPEFMPLALHKVGSEEEAIEYASTATRAWQGLPGAIDWLSRQFRSWRQRKHDKTHLLWERYMEDGLRALQTEQYAKSKRFLRFALRTAEKFGVDERLAQTLNQLGMDLLSEPEGAQDEEIFRRAVELDEQLYDSDSYELATDLHNLAAFYVEQERCSEAEALVQRALPAAEEIGDVHLLSSLLTLQSNIHNSRGEKELALSFKLRADEIHKQVDHDCCSHHRHH